jgi:hypothetical protein
MCYNIKHDDKEVFMTITTKMSIRDLTRKGNMLLEYDYIDIEDKKSNEYKGLFVPKQYAQDVKNFLQKKVKKERQKSLDKIMQFSGILDETTSGKSFQELKLEKGSSKCN